MFKFFHPRPTQNNPLPISTPKLHNSATILKFFHPLLTQNSLRPLACWDCGFESHRGHGCLSDVSVVCSQVQVSATSSALFQRNWLWRVIVSDLENSWIRRPWPTGGYRAKHGQNTSVHPLGLHGLFYWSKQEMTHRYFVFINNYVISIWIHGEGNDVDIAKQCSTVKDWI